MPSVETLVLKIFLKSKISSKTGPCFVSEPQRILFKRVKAAEACLDDIFDRIQYTQTMVQMIETRRAQLTAEAEKKMKEIKVVFCQENSVQIDLCSYRMSMECEWTLLIPSNPISKPILTNAMSNPKDRPLVNPFLQTKTLERI